jgi:hypothetical protein
MVAFWNAYPTHMQPPHPGEENLLLLTALTYEQWTQCFHLFTLQRADQNKQLSIRSKIRNQGKKKLKEGKEEKQRGEMRERERRKGEEKKEKRREEKRDPEILN